MRVRQWLMLVFLVGVLTTPATMAMAAASAPDDTFVDDTVVDDTVVDTTTPDTEAPTTTSGVVPQQDSGIVGADPNLDGGDIALIGVVGLLAVLVIAAWWMVRNDDEDGRPASPIDDSSML